MNNILKDLLHFLSENAWLVKTSLILVSVFILHWFECAIYRRLQPRLAKTPRVWDDTFLRALHLPLLSFIWLIAATLIAPVLMKELGVAMSLIPFISPLRQFLFVIALFWFAMRYITYVERNAIERAPNGKRKRDKTSIRAVSQLLRITLVVVALLVGMQTAGISIATLLAAGGIGGIAIGFAAKDTIANFLGGMMIFWDRPFSVGDWVRSPDRQIEGTVENIGWRLTRIRTFDKRPLYVPNGVFSTIAVENPSRMSNRRIKTTVGVRYDDATKVEDILKDIEKMLRNHPEIDANQTLMVNLFEFGPSSLNFFIYTFTKTTDWVKFQAIQQDVFLKIIAIITEHGAQCAFPTTTVHVPEGLIVKQP